MTFKTHLIIVLVIIGIVSLVWVSASSPTPDAPVTLSAPRKESPYSITIIHANWGKNCLFRVQRMGTNSYDSFAKKNNSPIAKLQDDNVLDKVSSLCNDKLQCIIPLDIATLGNPVPECRDKQLEVVYRCFSFDRPWVIKANSGSMFIDCSTAEDRE